MLFRSAKRPCDAVHFAQAHSAEFTRGIISPDLVEARQFTRILNRAAASQDLPANAAYSPRGQAAPMGLEMAAAGRLAGDVWFIVLSDPN